MRVAAGAEDADPFADWLRWGTGLTSGARQVIKWDGGAGVAGLLIL